MGLLLVKFRQFLTELSAATHPYFRFRIILDVCIDIEVSGNLVFGLVMGKFRQFMIEISAHDMNGRVLSVHVLFTVLS